MLVKLQPWILLACAGVAVVWVWLTCRDFAAAFYMFWVVVWGLGRSFGWPRADWFGSTRVCTLRESWGAQPLGVDYAQTAPVRDLAHNLRPKTYFQASMYDDQTKKICNGIMESLVLRTLGALGGFIFAMMFKAHEEAAATVAAAAAAARGQPIEPLTGEAAELAIMIGALKALALISPILFTLIWDVSRIERQRFMNKEVPAS